MLHIFLIWVILSIFKGSSGEIVVTQTPASLQKSPGDKVDIQCKASSSLDGYINFFQLIPGQKPKLLIYYAINRFQGTPPRFSGQGSGSDYTFSINGVRPEDEGEYCCGHVNTYPFTFGVGTKLMVKQRNDAAPSASIFPPSQEQLKTNSATLVCLITGFYPEELNVAWKADGKAVTGDVQTSSVESEADKTYKLSSTLALSRDEYNSHELYACEMTHKTLTGPLVKSFRRSECPS